MRSSSFVLAVAVGLTGVTLAAEASAADVQACLAASEKGQNLKKQGKLREAREQFLVCGAQSCPSLVRHDCTNWNSEIAQALPTVVFGAHDKSGKDLFDVTVSMDGEVLLKKLDGKAVNVDPGKHTFRFEVTGLPPHDEVVLIKEGEHARNVTVTLDNGKTETEGGTGTTAPSNPDKDHGDDKTVHVGHSVLPWVLVGLGVAAIGTGLIVALTAPDRPANCDKAKQRCTGTPGESDEQLQKEQEQAGRADSQPLIGYIVAGGGAALVIGGLVWHFVEPTDVSATHGMRVLPWTTGKASGLGLSGSF